jgi:carboxypeptidase PM20D1
LFLAKYGQPRRGIYLAYGHDEEISGYGGAFKIVDYLQSRNVTLEYVQDEGNSIVEDLFKNEINRPFGIVAAAEKGYLTIKFSVNSTGGHSAVPDAEHSSIFIMAQAITR